MSLASRGIAGFMSVLAFTWVHDLFISDIWGMLPTRGSDAPTWSEASDKR